MEKNGRIAYCSARCWFDSSQLMAMFFCIEKKLKNPPCDIGGAIMVARDDVFSY